MKTRMRIIESKETKETHPRETGPKCRCAGCGHKLFNIIEKVDAIGVHHKIVCANCGKNIIVEVSYQ